ncbi:MAG: aminotransferase class I/II-fold pyridoxal phosphate-dependent enzyme [Alphaproteobacteria bacterium]|nr:MAG: aminotransferase class I/II-fold pyridoxal phosphate-dependent enzyme [Alphaproteobacteria bacterium]
MIALTNFVRRIEGSRTLKLNAAAQEYAQKHSDFIALTVGEPDFTPPECVLTAVRKGMLDGVCRYTAVSGRPSLLHEIRNYFRDMRGITLTDDTAVIATNGSIQGIFNTLMATLLPEDEVLLPQPYWPTYETMVRLLGGTVVGIALEYINDYKVTPESLARHITPRTKWLLLNNPHNPTGAVYTYDEQQALGDVLRRHPHVNIICDEIYALLVHDGLPCPSFAHVNADLADRVVVVDGVSKCGALSGWRLGFAAGPRHLIEALGKIQSQQTSNPSVISQVAAEALLRNGFDFLKPFCAELKVRAAFVRTLFAEHGIVTSNPQGAYYILADIRPFLQKATGEIDDESFVHTLIAQEHLCVTPGSYFAAPGYVRICLTNTVDVLAEAVKRLLHCLTRLVA